MAQCSSKTEQLIYRSSYNKHKQRLEQMRPQLIAKDLRLPPSRPKDKKGALGRKMKQKEINHDNNLLKDKIGGIKNRTFYEPSLNSQTQNVRNQVRYEDDGKLELATNFFDGEPVRCILPSQRNRATSFLPRHKPQLQSYYSSKSRQNYRVKRPQSFHRTNANHKQVQRVQSQSREDQILYNLPQRNELRQVVHSKTVIVSPTQSCFFELSVIGQRMLIAAYLMGTDNYCVTELFTVKKTKQIIKEFQNNYEELYSRITLEGDKKCQSIRVNLSREAEAELKPSNGQELTKARLKAQLLFLERNYYTKLKKEVKQDEDKNKPTMTNDELHQLMDRLAAPKKGYARDHTSQMGGTIPSPHSIQQSRPSVHIDSKQTEERRKEIIKNQQQRKTTPGPSENRYPATQQQQVPPQKLKQTDSLVLDRNHSEKSSVSKGKSREESLPKSTHKSKKNQEEVEYLDGEDEYQESFQNPSGMSGSKPNTNTLDLNKNNSLASKRSQKSKIVNNQSNDYQNIYEDQYQNEQQEGMLESQVQPVTPKLPAKNSSAVVEEEYADQQFQA